MHATSTVGKRLFSAEFRTASAEGGKPVAQESFVRFLWGLGFGASRQVKTVRVVRSSREGRVCLVCLVAVLARLVLVRVVVNAGIIELLEVDPNEAMLFPNWANSTYTDTFFNSLKREGT
ncbi:hypothetical protein C8F04DRAFT_1192161 [Mycena alexandri]|uniref:Uncharacterized protein n=1 Tax=Mycena alexandri TaxID=1745969 RepID=A0AAD6WTD5_9AGAR|nr:hypothetical protein C8F04DRAFT_1192161 [Mycena alexandri]